MQCKCTQQMAAVKQAAAKHLVVITFAKKMSYVMSTGSSLTVPTFTGLPRLTQCSIGWITTVPYAQYTRCKFLVLKPSTTALGQMWSR